MDTAIASAIPQLRDPTRDQVGILTMNAASNNAKNKQIKRAVILLVLVAVCFYFGFIIATGMKG